MENKIILKSISWKLFERVSIQGVNLLVQIILARLLLPAEFGMLTIIVAITNYLAIFVQTGLSTAIIQKKDLDSLDVSTLSVFSLLIALLCYVCLFISAPVIVTSIYHMPELVSPLRVLGLILFFNAIHSVQVGLYTRDMRFQTLFGISFTCVVVSGGLGIVLAIRGFGIWALIVQSMLNIALFVIISKVRRDYKFSFAFSFAKLKQIYKFSGQIILTSVISGMHDLIRTTVIGKYYSKEDLAYYDKGLSYSWYISNISNNTLSAVLLPVFSRQQNDRDSLLDNTRKSMRMTSFLMFPLLLGISAISESLVIVLLTEKWIAATPFLSLFCVLRLAGCLETIDKQVYYALGNSTINLVFEICLLIVNVITISISVNYGVYIMAICATAVELLFLFVTFIISSKIYGYLIKYRLLDIYKPLINSLIMFFVVRSIQSLCNPSFWGLVVQVLAGFFSYILLAFITRDYNIHIFMNVLKNNKEGG